ncbi:MAG: hypothetical protein Q7S83_00550 [bacterium]|nr:hypothetical protein [bacterium]
MKNCLEEYLNTHDPTKRSEAWLQGLCAKKHAEDVGFPVSYQISTVGHWNSEKPQHFVAVTLYRLPADASNLEREKYDQWYKRIIGMTDNASEDSPPEPPKQ